MSLQKFSIFHETNPEALKAWHRPYAAVLAERKPVLDVGCGPGYFSEVVTSLGGECVGVDVDPAMIAVSVQRGQQAHLGDQHWISDHLDTFGAIHVSHVVEHLWGDELVVLLQNAYHALKSGGIIVIRTPNWENRFVRERLFWMDHTHKRPYPRELLVRMLSDLGMREVQSGSEPFGMNDTFVVAVKPGDGSETPSTVRFAQGTSKRSGGDWKAMLKRRARQFLGID